MPMLKRFLVGTFAAILLAPFAATLMARSDHARVTIEDDCDPATFNAAVGPGTCVGNGETTFQAFLAELKATQTVDEWEFDPDELDEVAAGSRVTAENEGGEAHTFTEVAKFGGGFVGVLNGPSGNPNPAPECASTVNGTPVPAPSALATLVPSGGELMTGALKDGTHLFQCCIHPWMRTVVTVGGDHDRDGGRGR